PLSSTSSYMWRMQRRDRGHDLMQKITSANQQKRSDSNTLPKRPGFHGCRGLTPIALRRFAGAQNRQATSRRLGRRPLKAAVKAGTLWSGIAAAGREVD